MDLSTRIDWKVSTDDMWVVTWMDGTLLGALLERIDGPGWMARVAGDTVTLGPYTNPGYAHDALVNRAISG